MVVPRFHGAPLKDDKPGSTQLPDLEGRAVTLGPHLRKYPLNADARFCFRGLRDWRAKDLDVPPRQAALGTEVILCGARTNHMVPLVISA
jgi:hypothetical protein